MTEEDISRIEHAIAMIHHKKYSQIIVYCLFLAALESDEEDMEKLAEKLVMSPLPL